MQLIGTRSDSTTYTILQADVNSLPIPDAGPDQTVECTGELTEVLLDGSGSFDPDGDPLEYEWSALEGVIIEDPYAETTRAWFPHGTKTVTLTVQDGINDPVDDQAVIAVQDSTDPGVDSCWAEPSKLWPPDHRMVDVAIFVITSDGCTDPQDLVVACKVSSNEPDDGTGDGAFTGDVDGQDGFTSDVPIGVLLYDPDLECFVGTVSLRAERDGSQSGRTYSIMCEVVDEAGNSTEADCVVVVPHDRRKQK